MCCKGKPPTKKYIKSLLRSENSATWDDLVEQCVDGWVAAMGEEKREDKIPGMQKAFAFGDVWTIGFCSYTYGHRLENGYVYNV